MTTVSEVISYTRDREYMSGVDRDKTRVKATGEVFTPTPLVQELLDQLDPEVFIKPDKTLLDPSCGDGQFLSEVLIRKVESGIDFEQALSTIYGVDLMPDNVKQCQDRLLCGKEDLRHIVEQNIVCADALTYHYRFDSTAPDVTDQDLITMENKVEVVSNIQTQPRKIKEKLKGNQDIIDEYIPSLGPSGI